MQIYTLFPFKKIIFVITALNNCKYAYLNCPMIFLLISLVLLLFYVALIIYYRQSWLQLKPYSPVAGKSIKHSTFITVIIVARNEEKNIGSCIESIIKQTYPENLFELI
jgi:poly-beta-1,6-N-acetyl-D-glucosamine synthase